MDQSTQSAPAEVVVPQLSNEENLSKLRGEYKALNISIGSMYADEKPQADIDIEENKRFELKKQIDRLNAQIESEKAQREHDEKLRQYLSIVEEYKTAVTDSVKHLASLPANVAKRSPEQTAAQAQHDETVKTIGDKLSAELTNQFNNVKRVINIPMGVTGKQLSATSTTGANNPDSKNAQLVKLMEQGKTNDELLAMGFIDGTVRYARWQFNKKSKQSNGK